MNDCAEYALFSRREMDRRYAGARARMAERKLDALVITGENFQYFAGGSASLALHYSLSRPNCLVLPVEGKPVNPEDHTVLEVGMVISTEPGLRMGDVHFLWEDTHVITEDGHQQLTLETTDLREIPF